VFQEDEKGFFCSGLVVRERDAEQIVDFENVRLHTDLTDFTMLMQESCQRC